MVESMRNMLVLGAVIVMGFGGPAVVKAQDAHDGRVVDPWFVDELREEQLFDSRLEIVVPRHRCDGSRRARVIELLRSADSF